MGNKGDTLPYDIILLVGALIALVVLIQVGFVAAAGELIQRLIASGFPPFP
jgi:hypothetical protein